MPDEVPDIYCDNVQISATPFDIVLELLKRPPGQITTERPLRVGVVRMSHQHAKVLSIILRSNLKDIEAQQGAPITIHPLALSALQLNIKEDW